MYKPLFMKKKEIQIRHVITPSVSISAAPDFGSSRYGYYDTYIKPNADGTQDTITYSPYAGQMFGVPGQGKSGNISLHYLGNGNKRADFVGNVRACLKNHFRNLYAPVCSIFHLNSVAVRQYIVNPI